MLSNGEQKIFIWVDFSPETEIAILHGVQVALILNKEICLLYHPRHGKEERETRLAGLTVPVGEIIGRERVHHCTMDQPLFKILTTLAEEYDALVLVAHKKNSRELLPHLPHSGFPFLFVSNPQQPESSYQKIAVPVGYMKKSKDLALWSSYFARHNGAKISLLRTLESSEEDNRRVMNNLFSIERLFRNFSFPSETIEVHTSTWKIQKAALNHALGFRQGLLIISFTYSSTIFDRLLGINDEYIIHHAESLSVMCINSQRDLYTLCG